MAQDLSRTLVVGISSTALFDLAAEARIFDERGIAAYRRHMLLHEDEPLEPGTGYPLVRALLSLNDHGQDEGQPLAEVVVMSRNSPETAVRILSTVRQLGLGISRFAFTGGEPIAPVATAIGVDLFLSTDESDVQRVVDDGSCAAAVLYPPPSGYEPPADQVRIAFDADAVLFSPASEAVYREGGLEAFERNEAAASDQPMPAGPFAAFLKKLAMLQERLPHRVEYSPIRLSIVTARGAPAEARVITTLRAWDVYVDAAYFLGGLPKAQLLATLRPHIFFDDQDVHALPASQLVPSGKVPYRRGSALNPGSSDRERPTRVPLSRSRADLDDQR